MNLERAIVAQRGQGIVVEEELLAHLLPIGQEHINLTGDCTWQTERRIQAATTFCSLERVIEIPKRTIVDVLCGDPFLHEVTFGRP